MPESVQILIEADDKASKKFDAASKAMAQTAKQVEQVVASLESPTQRYNKQLEELARLQKSGAITSDQFTKASTQLKQQLESSGESLKGVGKNAKGAGDAVSAFASATGSPEIGAFTGKLGMASNELAKFRDMAGQAGSGAMAFKAGLVGMVAVLSFQIGSAIGNALFQTQKWKEELEAAKREAERLDAALLAASSRRFKLELDEISVIRDPEEQSRETAKLLKGIEKQIDDKNKQIQDKLNAEEDFNTAWFGSPEDRAAMRDTSVEEKQLELLRQQRDVLKESTSERRKAIEDKRKENALIDQSQAYVESLKQEVDFLQATREQQIELEASRRAMGDDVGFAEQLLRERDAILAKQQAARDAEAEKKRAAERQKAEDERRAQAIKREIERIKNAEEAERQRLKIARIAIEQGKEAAKVASLVAQGIDEATAKQLAAEEAAIDLLKEKSKVKDEKVAGPKAAGPQSLQASESRFLTRGPGQRPEELWKRIADEVQKLQKPMDVVAKATEKAADETEKVATNTAQTTNLVVPA
jgi:hypothetical protein